MNVGIMEPESCDKPLADDWLTTDIKCSSDRAIGASRKQ
jgi:hypothetical protein